MTSNKISVQINGKAVELPEETSVFSVLESKGINPHVVACELNLNIVRRANLKTTTLKNGDTLEIIQMIGGG